MPYTVTGVKRNVVTSIGSRHAFKVLEEAYEDLNRSEKLAAPGNLFAGLALTEYREDFGEGFSGSQHPWADPEKGSHSGLFPGAGRPCSFT